MPNDLFWHYALTGVLLTLCLLICVLMTIQSVKARNAALRICQYTRDGVHVAALARMRQLERNGRNGIREEECSDAEMLMAVSFYARAAEIQASRVIHDRDNPLSPLALSMLLPTFPSTTLGPPLRDCAYLWNLAHSAAYLLTAIDRELTRLGKEQAREMFVSRFFQVIEACREVTRERAQGAISELDVADAEKAPVR